MDWLKYMMLGDLGQSIDISETRKRLTAQERILRDNTRIMRGKTLSQDQKIARLEDRTERLNLALTALCRFMIAKKVVDARELEEFIELVDVEDGEADGRLDFDDEDLAKPKLQFPPI